MFDVHEYMLSIRERDKALLEIANSINEVVACLQRGREGEEDLARAVDKMNAFRQAYVALSEHGQQLIACA